MDTKLSLVSIASLVVFVCMNPVALCGINGSAQTIDLTIDLPKGTQIDLKLSEYYGLPVASGSNGTYWYVAQSWHTSEEIADHMTNSQMHAAPRSDYGAFSNDMISMPVNPLLIVIFLGMMYCISKRIT